MNSYESKVKQMESILQEHNDALTDDESGSVINIEKVKANLRINGATNENALAQCSFEDLESYGIPKLLAKQIASVFRKSDSQTTTDNWVSSKKAERMTYEELLSRYNPEEDNAVYKRLKEIGHGNRFIVFQEGNIVDVSTSATLLQEIKKGFGERPLGAITVGDVLKPIYRVGEQPDNYVDENPLYHGRALRPDGTCDQINRSWLGVPINTRQLIYLAVKVGELNDISNRANDILDLALDTENGGKKLMQRFPKATLKFNELDKIGQLPRLKIELGKQTNRVGLSAGKRVKFHEED